MKPDAIDVREHRSPDHPIDRIFLERWSPRAMSGRPMAVSELNRLFEAARWAPSSYNGQPWRFVWARRETDSWDRFVDLLVEGNRRWARDAAVLVLICSRKRFERNDKPSRTHSFDAGSAWMSLALQGALLGRVVHGMEGFDYERAREVAGVPEVFAVEAMCAIGHPGEIDDLPEPLREREVPSGREPVSELAFEGRFPTG